MHSPSENAAPRLLVIDDNPAIHEDFRKILGSGLKSAQAVARAEAALFGDAPSEDTRPQFRIDSAFQGEEGVAFVERALAENRPHALAFVDMRMPPGMDGIETVARIWERDPGMQIVICTAYSDYSWQEVCDGLGRSDRLMILKKPFDNIEVLQLAHALTARWRLTQEVKCRVQDLERRISAQVCKYERADAVATELQAIRDSARALLTIVNDIPRNSAS